MADYSYKLKIDVENRGIKETRAELERLKQQLEDAKGKSSTDMAKKMFEGGISSAKDAKKAIQIVIDALDKLEKKGKDATVLDMARFNAEIGQAGVKIRALDNVLEKSGVSGARAIGKITTATHDLGLQIDRVDDKFSKLGREIQDELVDNAVNFGFDMMADSVSKAIYFTKDLDRTLTDISVVSGKSAEEMAAFSEYANEAARNLGSSTDEFAKSSLIFFQQGGYTTAEVQKLAEATTIAANITRQTTDVVADQLTAIINSFGVESGKVMTDVVDVFAKIGAVSGANFEELATATQKFASQAQTAGYEGADGIKEMGAQIATVVETTRQSADSIGVGFKTILSRIQGIKEDKSGEMVTKLSKSVGQLNAELKNLGAEQFEIFDQFGQLRGADELINDLGETWNQYGDSLSSATKQYVLQEVAGVEQASRLAALLDNWDDYLRILDEAQNSQGTALQQQLIYMDSIDAKAAELRTAFENVVMGLNVDEVIKSILDGATNLTDAFASISESTSNMGAEFAKALGVSQELGETLGAWAPILGVGVAALQKFYGATIATRFATMGIKNEYMQQLNAQKASTVEEKNRLALVKNIASYSGAEEAQKYEQLQVQINKQLEKQQHHLKVIEEIDLKIKNHRKENKELRENIKFIKEQKVAISAVHEMVERVGQGETDINKLLGEQNAKVKSILENNRHFQPLLDKELITEKEILAVLEKQKNAKDLATAKAEVTAVEKNLTGESIDEHQDAANMAGDNVNKLSQQQDKIEKLNRSMEKTQMILGGISAAALGGTQVFSGLSQIMEEGMGNGLGLAKVISGVGTAILALLPTITALIAKLGVAWATALAPFLPWIAAAMVAVGGLITLMGGFKSEAQKIKEANEEITKTFTEQKERIDNLKKSLDGVKDSYKELQETGMTAQEILASGDQELIDKYEAYANTVKETNASLILGYDEQGRAIVDLTNSYSGMNAELERQETANFQMLASNSKGYISQISTEFQAATQSIEALREKHSETQKQLTSAMESGNTDEVTRLSSEIATLNLEIGTQQEILSNSSAMIHANIIEPFHKGSKEVSEFNDKFGSMTIKTKDGLVSLGGAVSKTVLDIQSFNSAIQSGNIDKANMMLENAKGSYTLLTDEMTKAGDSAEEMMTKFMQLPPHIQQAGITLQQAFNNVDLDILETADERIKSILTTDKSLGEVLELSDEDINVSLISDTEEKISSLRERMKELANETDRNGEMVYANREEYSELSSTVAMYEEQLENMSDLAGDNVDSINASEEAFEDLIESMTDTTEGLIEVSESYNNFLTQLADMEVGTEGYDEVLNKAQMMYAELMKSDEDWFSQFKQNNSDWVAEVEEATGLNLEKYKTLEELRTAAEAEGHNIRLQGTLFATQAELNAWRETKYQEQVAAWETAQQSFNAQQVSIMSSIQLYNSLKQAGYSTGDAIKIVFASIGDAILNGIAGAINSTTGNIAQFLNWVREQINNVIKQINQIPFVNIPLMKGNVKGTSFNTNRNTAGALADSLAKDDTYSQGSVMDTVKPPKLPAPTKPPGSGNPDNTGPGTGDPGGDKDSGKDKDKEKEDVEDVELELDPLYEYTKALELLENEMSILQALEKDLFGEDLISNLQQQNTLLEKKLKILESQKTVIDQQMARQQDLLGSKGFTFDESGMITNYNEMIEKLTNAANAKTGEAKEQAIADLEQIKETVKDYDKFLTDTNAKLEEDLIKIRQEIQENYQEQIEIVVDVNLDLSEAYEKIYEFQQKFNEGFDKTSESLENMNEYAQSLMGDMNNMQDVIEKVKNDANLTEKQKGELLKKYIEEYMDSAEKLDDVIKEMGEKITESLEEGLELIEETAEGYEKIKDYASDYADLLLDMYGPAAKDDIDALFQVQIDAQQGILDSLKSQKELAEQYVNALEPGSEEWKAAKEELDNINMEIANNTLGLLDLMREKMQSFFDLSREALEQDIFGGKSLEEVEDAFDRINAQQDKYVSTAEKVNKIGKLQVEIQKEIEKTTDPKKKAMLQAFLDKEIKALKEKDKLTEKDVERAEKVYLLLLKQQAVQTSQMTAMMARLVRDEAGNWSYEYVQDVNKVNEAQQDLADGLEDLMNSDKDNLKENQEEMLGMYDQYFSDLQKLQEQAMAGEFESPEAFNAAVDALNQQLLEQMAQLEKEQENLINNMMQSSMAYYMQMYQQSGGNLGIFSSQTEGVLGGLLGALDKGSLAWSDIMSGNYKVIAEQLGITEAEAKAAMEEMTSSIMEDFEESNSFIETDYEDLRDKVEQAANDMKDSFNDYFTGVEENMGNQENAIADLVTSLGQQKDAVDKVTQAVKDEAGAITNTLIPSYEALKDKYQKEVNPETQKFVDKLKESIEQLKSNNTSITGSKGLNEALGKLQDEFEKSKTEADKLIGDKNSGLKGMEASADSAFQKVTTVKGRVKTDTDTMNRNVSGVSSNLNNLTTTADSVVSSVNSKLAGIKDKTVTATVRVKDKIVRIDKLPGSTRERYTTSLGYTKTGYGFEVGDILTFKTGGYTGNWSGNEGVQGDKDRGKLALLHQKEMVLNKQDTANLLEAVKINRDTFASLLKVNPQTSSVVNNDSSQGDTIIQVDNLELPNVTNADDFVKELKNLPNRAIQYKYTKKS